MIDKLDNGEPMVWVEDDLREKERLREYLLMSGDGGDEATERMLSNLSHVLAREGTQ